MSEFIELLVQPLRYPFMIRGLLASLMVGTICAVVGTYVVLRGMAFFGDALAHVLDPLDGSGAQALFVVAPATDPRKWTRARGEVFGEGERRNGEPEDEANGRNERSEHELSSGPGFGSPSRTPSPTERSTSPGARGSSP